MKLIGILGVSLLFLLSACSPKTETNSAQVKSNTNVEQNNSSSEIVINNETLFIKEFNAFYNAFKTKDQKTINNYIDPNYGFIIIYSEGAMPQVANTNNLIDFTTNTDRAIHEFVTFPDINLKNEELPKIDCNSNTFYNKSGSFFSSENPTLEQEMWIYGNFGDKEKEAFKNAAQNLTYNLIVTGHARYGIQFSGNKLKVIFIDFRKPCNS